MTKNSLRLGKVGRRIAGIRIVSPSYKIRVLKTQNLKLYVPMQYGTVFCQKNVEKVEGINTGIYLILVFI